MDPTQAARTLEVIRTLMERATQYQLLTARAALVAGALAVLGAASGFWLDPVSPWNFGAVWAAVFVFAAAATVIGTTRRGRQQGEHVWSRQARAVLLALTPALFSALVLSVYFFSRGEHLVLPGVWMLCYGQGALATATFAPKAIAILGIVALAGGAITLFLGATWALLMMGLVFGAGHLVLGIALLVLERRQRALRVYWSAA
jgi:hypothetical protein